MATATQTTLIGRNGYEYDATPIYGEFYKVGRNVVLADDGEVERNATDFEKWFATFLSEKQLPEKNWEIVAADGMTHYIGSEVVIEHIFATCDAEQSQIKNTIVKIDFANGDVNHFFRFLAGVLVGEATPQQ